MPATRRQQLLHFLASNPGASLPDIRQRLQIGSSNAGRIVADAMAAGQVGKYGSRRLYSYYLTDSGYRDAGAKTPRATGSIFNFAAAQAR